MKSDSRLFTFYPFLFAFYPALALLVLNIDQTNPLSLARLVGISLALSLVVWLVLSLLLKNLRKSAILTLAIQVIFFSYGHEQHLLGSIARIGPTLVDNRFLLSLNLVLLAILTYWIIRTRADLASASRYLTYTNIFLLVMPLLQIGYHDYVNRQPISMPGGQQYHSQGQGDMPDIYYIILDSYSREDLMKADFKYDNQPFVDQLTSLGFQVIPCSRSNYNATALTLSSMLNLNYDDSMGILASDVSSGQNPMIPFIKNNQVRYFLQQLGYSFYTFDIDFPELEWPGTNKFAMPKQESWASDQLLPIETLFIKDTALNIMMESQVGIFKQFQTKIDSPYAAHIQRIQYILKRLPDTASLPGPKFVYAHLLLPHKPFVFEADGTIRTDTRFFKGGNPINDDFYRDGYVAQVEYTNSQVEPVVASILKNSRKPPVIILMGDHGYAARDTRFENLLAVYLPGNKPSPLYANMTNVNVFRSIFNEYFGGKYEMLPDVSYRIDFKKGVYLQVPEAQPGCKAAAKP
jgi:hypothetical protein